MSNQQDYNLEALIEGEGRGNDPFFEDQTGDELPGPVRYSITSYGTDLEVELLVKRLQDNTYVIPDYQRGYVWTQSRASQFVESLLLGLPVPGIFLYRNPDKTFLVIDGHQRMKTLRAFYEKEFPNSQTLFTLKAVDARFLEKSIDGLDEADKRALDVSVIHATVIEQDQPDEAEKSSITQLFRRINSGAVPLTPHEIRYCVSYDTLAKEIKLWNDDLNWRTLIGPKSSRMKDQEQILRFIALFSEASDYTAPMQSFLDSFLERHRREVTINGMNCEEVFRKTCKHVLQVLGNNAFRLGSSAVNAALIDAVLVATAKGITSGKLRVDQEFREGYERLKADPAFLDAIGRATARKDAVSLRINQATEAFTTP